MENTYHGNAAYSEQQGQDNRAHITPKPVQSAFSTVDESTSTPPRRALQGDQQNKGSTPSQQQGYGDSPVPLERSAAVDNLAGDGSPGAAREVELQGAPDTSQKFTPPTTENAQRTDQEAAAASAEAEALAQAEALKREGNEMFGKGLWNEAMAKYNEALDTAPKTATKQLAIYFANMAACNIKTQQYAYAVQNCTEAIRLDGSYTKAYMRRCEALERLDELDNALGDAKALLLVEPDNAWAKTKVAALQPKVDERTEKLKAEMFSKLKELGNTVLGKFGLSVDNFKFDKDPNTGGYSIRFER